MSATARMERNSKLVARAEELLSDASDWAAWYAQHAMEGRAEDAAGDLARFEHQVRLALDQLGQVELGERK
ncbi:MAG TPA: hypothetical protein VKY85_01415 [Candidatus Angelobacter sp.]|nr:hypothetical protein [Candidatus Angelobacter sp.]